MLRAKGILLAGSALATGVAFAAAPALAADAKQEPAPAAPTVQEVVVTGSRAAARTVASSDVPVDVISATSLRKAASADLLDQLSEAVPSFSVQTKPLITTKIFVRPAGLRGLQADDTLVLVNGKRQHRTANVDFNILGGGVQGVDLSQIPSSAVSRTEVLRDGASAQYGSDAIAGVINIFLKDTPGFQGSVQAGRYYAGDGDSVQVDLADGVKLGERGYVNLAIEYNKQEPTSRSLQQEAAQALIDAGDTAVRQPAVVTWGLPHVVMSRYVINTHYDLTDDAQLYAFAIYGLSSGNSNVNWRSPSNSTLKRSIFQNPPDSIDPTYSALARFPGGYVPFFKMTGEDYTWVAGLKGKVLNDLSYDLSVDRGENQTKFYVYDSYNASMGRASPTSFYTGRLQQDEWTINADFTYPLEIGLAKPVNLAFGAEYRREMWGALTGDVASYEIGPYADLPSGQQGGVTIYPNAVGHWARNNTALYVDADFNPTSRLDVDVAGRYEDYPDFGSTVTGKLAGRYQVVEGVALRGAVSTGFRAPTVGQEHASSTALSPDFTNPGAIITQTQLPTTDPQAIALGAKPLKPEKSVNLSGGVVLQPISNLLVTLDGYRIDIRDRLSISQTFQPAPGFRYTFFVNGYRTRTTGADLVATYAAPMPEGQDLTLTASANYNSTKVVSFTPGDIAPVQITAVQRKLPHWSGILSADYARGPWEVTGKVRYYGSVIDIFADLPQAEQRIPGIAFFDLSVGYNINPHWRVQVAAENLFNHHPERAIYGGPLTSVNHFDFGRIYPSNLPYDFNGGRYYVRISARY